MWSDRSDDKVYDVPRRAKLPGFALASEYGEQVLEGIAKRMEGVEVTIRARANEDGVLYGSVGRREISAALAEEGHHVAVEQIQLHTPLRRLDNIEVELRFASDLRSTIKVWVVREKTGEEGEEDKEQEATPVGREAGEHDTRNDQ